MPWADAVLSALLPQRRVNFTRVSFSCTSVGLNTRTFVDQFRTPHSDKLHVVERFRLIDGGKAIEAIATVDDPGAFTTPWRGMQRYRQVEQGPMVENACAENNEGFFERAVDPIPTAAKADF